MRAREEGRLLDVSERVMLEALSARLATLLPIRGKRIGMELAFGDVGFLELLPEADRGEHVGPFCLWKTGTSLGLCTIRDGAPLRGTVSVGTLRDRRDLRFPAYVEGFVLALRKLVQRENARIVEDWAIGRLDVRPPLGVLPEGTSALRYRDYFLTAPWLGWFVEVPAKPLRWMPAPEEVVVDANGAIDLYELRHWVSRHVPQTYRNRQWDNAMRASVPEPVRVIWSIHWLDAMVGGNGFEVYLSQASGAVMRDMHHALRAIGAVRMLERMTRGIALAARQGAEFMHERGRKWVDAFDDPAPSWQEIDRGPEGSFELLPSEVLPAAQRYAEAHRASFVR
jgi:hypothetical protein